MSEHLNAGLLSTNAPLKSTNLQDLFRKLLLESALVSYLDINDKYLISIGLSETAIKRKSSLRKLNPLFLP